MCIWPSISEDKPRLPRCIQTSKRHAVLLQDGFLLKKNGLPKKTWIWIYVHWILWAALSGRPEALAEAGWWHRPVQSRKKSRGWAWHKHWLRWYAQCWMDARLGFSSIFFWEAFLYLGLFHPFGNCLPASIEGRLWSGAKSGITTSAGHASSRLKSCRVFFGWWNRWFLWIFVANLWDDLGWYWMEAGFWWSRIEIYWDGYPLVNITLRWKDPPFSMG